MVLLAKTIPKTNAVRSGAHRTTCLGMPLHGWILDAGTVFSSAGADADHVADVDGELVRWRDVPELELIGAGGIVLAIHCEGISAARSQYLLLIMKTQCVKEDSALVIVETPINIIVVS